MGGPGLFPQFSILDPEVIRSIPKKQICNGITDAYTHVLEHTMTVKTSANTSRPFLLKVFYKLYKKLLQKRWKEEFDYDSAANFLCGVCTMALNGLIQKESF
jgi:NADP-dependent alcohol dehydrogenase